MNMSQYDLGRGMSAIQAQPQYGMPALQYQPAQEKLIGGYIGGEAQRQLQAGQSALTMKPRRQQLELEKKDWELGKKLGKRERTASIINVGLSALGGFMTTLDYMKQKKRQDEMNEFLDTYINIFREHREKQKALYQPSYTPYTPALTPQFGGQ